jgi:hypothetical protein
MRDGNYWALVESERVAGKPRQRVVAYLGDVRKEYGEAVQRAAEGRDSSQLGLFDTGQRPEHVEIDFKSVRVERPRKFGGYWLGLQVVEKLGLRELFEEKMPQGREQVPWSLMALVLILSRLCDPCSELHIAEQIAHHSALSDLLGIAPDKINEARLYRSLDALLVHKEDVEKHLVDRMGSLFSIEYDLLLYDITSTYFEGQASGNEQAKLGHSRDHRSRSSASDSPGLQASLHRSGGESRRAAIGLRVVRRQSC